MITLAFLHLHRLTSAALFNAKRLVELRVVVKLIAANQAPHLQLVTSQRRFYQSPNALLLAVCDGRVTLIHHRARKGYCVHDWSLLKSVCAQHGWTLREDQRQQNQPVLVERRSRHTKAGFVLLMSSVFSTLTLASEWVGVATSVHSNTTVVRAFNIFTPAPTAIFELPRVNAQIAYRDVPNQYDLHHVAAKSDKYKNYDPKKYRRALKILHKKWVKTSNDPDWLASDMEELARYIASQPAAYELLRSLAKKTLHLQYKAGEFRSVVKGNALTVRSVKVYFDPRSAAQLQDALHCEQNTAHCVASPADALMHELLHAKMALVDTARFIRSGAMHALSYPRAHEYEVIDRERALYAAMSANDNLPRPQRKHHSGALLRSACITCLDG